MNRGSISGFSAKYGGGVYVDNNGKFYLNGGSIYNNKASYGFFTFGQDIYNLGYFYMNGGTVGTSSNSASYGIYNKGTMAINGGIVYDHVYSTNSFNTKPAAKIVGKISLNDSASITVENAGSTTPSYTISISSSRSDGAIVIFEDCTSLPNLDNISISGYDSETKRIVATFDEDESTGYISLTDIKQVTINPENGEASQEKTGITNEVVTLPSYSKYGYTYKGYQSDHAYIGINNQTDNTWYAIDSKYKFEDLLTVNCWVYLDNWNNFTRALSCTESGGWNFEKDTVNGKLVVRFSGYDSGIGYKATDGVELSTISAGWHMLTGTFDGKKLRFYFDGVFKNASEVYSSGKIGYNLTNSIIVGAEAGIGKNEIDGSVGVLPGKIKKVSIINSAFGASDILSMYQNGNDGTGIYYGFSNNATDELTAQWEELTLNVKFEPNGGTVSQTTSTVKFGEKYSFPSAPKKVGYDFVGWSRNFFDVENGSLSYSYCTREGTTFTMDTGTSNTTQSGAFLQVQSWKDSEYLNYLFSKNETGEYSFTFTKTSDFNFLRVKLNGNNRDGDFRYDVSNLPNGDYVFHVNIVSIEMNKMVVKDIMIEQNAGNVATSYTNEVVTSSTLVSTAYDHTLFAWWAKKTEADLPSDWKSQVALSTYMTTTVTPANLTSIKFVSTVPSGYSLIGVLSTGLPVYQGTTATDIAFVCPKIYAPQSSYNLFSELSAVATIDTTSLDTSKVTNMEKMFYKCSSLTSLDLSSFNTLNVTNMNYMFYGCSGLTSLNIGNFNSSNVTDMSGMFGSCSKLSSLDLSKFNTQKVNVMSNMFDGCSSLSSLDLSSFNTSNVTNMTAMFVGCSSLTSLNVSSFDTSKVTNFSRMFSYCVKLPTLNVGNFVTTSATNMNSMFYSCYALTGLDLSGFTTSNVKEMMEMFYNCSSLTSLDLSSFNTSNVTNMMQMFYRCSNLNSLDVRNFNTSNVTSFNNTFLGCSQLTSLDLSGFNTSKVYNMCGMFRECSNLTNLDLSNFDTSLVEDMCQMFYNSPSLISLNLSSFNTSKVTDLSWMFFGCSRLTNLDLSNFDTSNVTDMSSMFKSCRAVTNLDLSNFDTSNVTDMSDMFSQCAKLKNLNLSSFNTSKVTDMSGMFYLYYVYGSSLTSLDLSNFDTSNVTNMSYMFYDFKSLASLDLSNFDTSKVTDMRYMFYGCSGLKTLDLSSFNMSSVTSQTNMLNFGSSNKIAVLNTPYNNSSELSITTGSALYNVSTNISVSSVPANTSSSLTYAIMIDLTFDENGGTCSTSSLSAFAGVSLSSQGITLPTATKSGYTFNGWSKSSSSLIRVSESSILTEDMTLYANFTEESTIEEGEVYNSSDLVESLNTFFSEHSLLTGSGRWTFDEVTSIAILPNNDDAFSRYDMSYVGNLGVGLSVYRGSPSATKIADIMGSDVLCLVAVGSGNFVQFVSIDFIDDLYNYFGNYTNIDLYGWDWRTEPYNYDQIDVHANISNLILPRNYSAGLEVYVYDSNTKVYRYSGTTYSNVIQAFADLNNGLNCDFGLVKTFSFEKEELTDCDVSNMGDEKIIDNKRKIKIVSSVKKE